MEPTSIVVNFLNESTTYNGDVFKWPNGVYTDVKEMNIQITVKDGRVFERYMKEDWKEINPLDDQNRYRVIRYRQIATEFEIVLTYVITNK